MEDNAKKILGRLQAQCAKREYCSSDVFEKAKKLLEGDAVAAAEIVEALLLEKYVDDFRFASAFVREKSALQGWGKVKISYMLTAKGIAKEVIGKALDEVDDDAASRKMENVIRIKYRLLADDSQCRLKLLKFALGRGYSYDEVKPVVEKVMSDGAEK